MANSFSDKVKKQKDNEKNISIADLLEDTASVEVVSNAKQNGRFFEVNPKLCIPDENQPRKTFDDEKLIELMESIENIGQIDPILVKPKQEDGTFPIISGERRWRAISRSSTLDTIDIIISKKAIENSDAYSNSLLKLKTQIHENELSENVPAIETAISIKNEMMATGLNQEKIAIELKMPKSKVSKLLALIKAPHEIQELSATKELTDIDSLYNLAKAAEIAPKKATELVAQWKEGKLDKSMRKASEELASEVKAERKAGSNVDNKKPKKEALSIDLYGCEIKKNGDKYDLVLMAGKTKNIYFSCSDTAINNIINALQAR